MDDDVKGESAVQAAPEETVTDDSSSTSENTEQENELSDDLADFEKELGEGQPDEENSEEAETEESQTSTADDTPGKNARIEKLTQEIAELKSQIGVAPNADVRLAVKERNLLRELADNDIKGQALTLEQKLLTQVNPDTGEYYSPSEAASIARNAEIEAQRENLTIQQQEVTIERNQGVIGNEISTAIQQNPIFQATLPNGQPNPEYDAQAAEMAGLRLMNSYLKVPVLDENGNQAVDDNGVPVERVVGIRQSPLEIFKSVADSREAVRKSAEARAADNLSRQAASADVRTSSSTSANRKDPELEEFNEHFGL